MKDQSLRSASFGPRRGTRDLPTLKQVDSVHVIDPASGPGQKTIKTIPEPENRLPSSVASVASSAAPRSAPAAAPPAAHGASGRGAPHVARTRRGPDPGKGGPQQRAPGVRQDVSQEVECHPCLG